MFSAFGAASGDVIDEKTAARLLQEEVSLVYI